MCTPILLLPGLYDCPCTMDGVGRQWGELFTEEILEQPGTFRICYALSTVAKIRLQRLNDISINRVSSV